MPGGAPLVDVHHLGLGETGNETWSRNVVRVLEADGGPKVEYAATELGRDELPADRFHLVGGSSARRLVVELPRLVRSLRSSAVLAQYTLPLVRVPGVVVVHDVSFVEPASRAWIPPRSRARYQLTIGTSIRRARVVVVPTDYTRQQLLAHYRLDPERVLLAPLALDPDLAASLDVPRTPYDVPTVLCVGTLLPRKNLPVVAEAVARLRRQGSEVRLRLVGPVRPAGEADLQRMTGLLGDAVDVVGPVSPQQLVREYASASVLAYPSLHEGFGLPLLEGMAAGIPVVSSSATCLPEVAGDAAALVAPDDVAGWAAALQDALERPDLRAVQAQARVRRFSWEATGAVVRTALERAAG